MTVRADHGQVGQLRLDGLVRVSKLALVVNDQTSSSETPRNTREVTTAGSTHAASLSDGILPQSRVAVPRAGFSGRTFDSTLYGRQRPTPRRSPDRSGQVVRNSLWAGGSAEAGALVDVVARHGFVQRDDVSSHVFHALPWATTGHPPASANLAVADEGVDGSAHIAEHPITLQCVVRKEERNV